MLQIWATKVFHNFNVKWNHPIRKPKINILCNYCAGRLESGENTAETCSNVIFTLFSMRSKKWCYRILSTLSKKLISRRWTALQFFRGFTHFYGITQSTWHSFNSALHLIAKSSSDDLFRASFSWDWSIDHKNRKNFIAFRKALKEIWFSILIWTFVRIFTIYGHIIEFRKDIKGEAHQSFLQNSF